MTAPNLPSEPPMTQDNSTAQLLPCPFCGASPIRWLAGELADEGIINELAGCYGNDPRKPHPFLRMTPSAWNTRAPVSQNAAQLVERLFAMLCQKYVQRADKRQRAMGLQYTEAETHDLAKTIAAFIEALTRVQPSIGDKGAQQADELSQAEPVSRLGPTGFDPSREEVEAIDWLECQTKMVRDWHYKCQEEIINFQRMGGEYALFQEQWEEREKHYRRKRRILETLSAIVKDRDEWREQHENLVYVRQADLAAVAIATEARRAETTEIGSVHEGAGGEAVSPETHQGDSTK